MVAACTEAPRLAVDDSKLTAAELAEFPPAPAPVYGPASTSAETCTFTEGVCRTGRCELPNDTKQTLTEVCCTAPGVCTTEHYVLCGC